MKIDWKTMRRNLEAENRRIRERRKERYEEISEVLKESGKANSSPGRALLRMGTSGQPRSRIFGEKMAIPKGKR